MWFIFLVDFKKDAIFSAVRIKMFCTLCSFKQDEKQTVTTKMDC